MVFRNRLALVAGLAGGAVLLSAAGAFAHVSMTKVGFANQNQVVTFGIGHGCEGADSYKLEVKIPEEVASLRVMPSAWGEAEVTKNEAGTITSVTWSKSDVRAEDDSYYEFALRIKVPDAPFTTVLFPATQTCRNAAGDETVVEWAATAEEVAAAPAGEEVEPAPTLLVLPPRVPGWNKYTVKDKVTDMAAFADAQIVWAGDAAYSANPATMELIKGEDGVTELTEIEAGAEIWVKY
jgi:periplasmic copper chaperone A